MAKVIQLRTKKLYEKAKLENMETEKFIKSKQSIEQKKVSDIIDATLKVSDNIVDIDQYKGDVLQKIYDYKHETSIDYHHEKLKVIRQFRNPIQFNN